MARRYRFATTADGQNLWFCLALKEGWTACYRLLPRDGRPVVVEVRVVPTPPDAVVNIDEDGNPVGHHEPPGDGLTAAILKNRLVVGRHIYELLPDALRRVRSTVGSYPFTLPDGTETTLYEAVVGALGFDVDKKPKRGKRGPKPEPEEDLAELVAEYLEACKTSSRPVVDVAEARGMTPGAVRGAMYRARKRGLLTRQTAGRAGGKLTKRGKAALRRKRR